MSIWKCRNCGQISHIDEISDKDGICLHHPAGVGNHSFAQWSLSPEETPEYCSCGDLSVAHYENAGCLLCACSKDISQIEQDAEIEAELAAELEAK